MDVKTLERELQNARVEAEAHARIAEGTVARARMSQRRLELLERLVETELALQELPAGDGAVPADPKLLERIRQITRELETVAAPRLSLAMDSAAEQRKTPPKQRGQAAVLIEAAKAALGRAHRPLHISELRESVEGAGIPIPGQGEDANLIVHLRKSDEIVRVGRGFYGLADWGLGTAPKAAVTRKPRRARR